MQDLVPNLDEFSTERMIPPYREPITVDFLRRLAQNTSYVKRRTESALLLFNEHLDPGETKTYDTGKDYNGVYVEVMFRQFMSSQTLPLDYDAIDTWHPSLQKLTQGFKSTNSASLTIAALPAGGFQLRSAFESERYLVGTVRELRCVYELPENADDGS